MPPPDPAGIANIATSAPQATPRAAVTASVNVALGRATITLATAVPWDLWSPVSSVAPPRNSSLTVLPANAGCPVSMPVSMTPTVMPLPGAVPLPCSSSSCAQARSALIVLSPHWFLKSSSSLCPSSMISRSSRYWSGEMQPEAV